MSSIYERVLTTLACKYVDDVVIGAPYELTRDLINALNINKVVHIVNSKVETILP